MTYAKVEPSQLPRSRLRLTALQITRQARLASVYMAAANTLVRTFRVAREDGSVIRGRSTSSSIGRLPNCDRSDRILAALPLPSDAATSGCPNAVGSRDRRQWRVRSDRGSYTGRRTSTRRSLGPPYLRRGSQAHSTAAPLPPARR